MNEFWDGPRLGVANVRGVAHIYRSPFDATKDDFSDFYLVAPISGELLQLVMADWDIWLRWLAAFERGETGRDTHPALPEDRERHEELKRLIGDRLSVDEVQGRKLNATFRSTHFGWDGFEVEWTDLR